MSFSNLQKKDLSFGKKAEKDLLPLFRDNFDKNLQQTTWTYNSIDFESENTIVELKSRKCYYDDYKDMMIGANKVKRVSDEFAKNKRQGYLVFNCLDGIYYWKFNVEESKNAVSYRMGGREDRGKDEKELTAYINKDYLKCLLLKEVPKKEPYLKGVCLIKL
jgi:hypothetical protein